MKTLRIVTWNVQWANPKTDRGQACIDRLREVDPDVVCLTEAFENSLHALGGYSQSSDPDYGYPLKPGRRKVVIWSRWPLAETDSVGSAELPTGRFVSGAITQPLQLSMLGVCIPWRDAHVNSGKRNRQAWENHSRYLSGLNEVETFANDTRPTIVFGDFNQRISGKYARKDVHEQLKQTFQHFEIPTADLFDSDGKSAIDHIAIRNLGQVTDAGVISRFDENSSRLSDHFGVWCNVEVQ